MNKVALLASLTLSLILSTNAQAQSSSEGQAEQNKSRTNSVSGQFQMVNPGRKLLVAPDWSTTKVQESCKISFILDVDPQGRVLGGKAVEAKTSTYDFMLIENTLERLKKEARYETKNSASNERVPYEFSLNAE